MILDVTAKTIKTMFEGIRTKLMIKRQKIREKIDLSKWLITPTYGERLEENMKYVKYYQTDMAGPNIWQVSSKKKNIFCELGKS